MILEIDEKTLPLIKNTALRSYAGRYVSIYKNFMEQMSHLGLEVDAQDDREQVQTTIAALRKKGIKIRNDARSIVYHDLSPACKACQKGVGSVTFFISLKCHRDCFYCFNPNQEGYLHFLEHSRDLESELDDLRDSEQPVRHLGLTGGEPLLHKEKTISFFQKARKDFHDVYTRMYTSGDHLDRDTLQALKHAHLDEIRFSIRMHDLAKGQRHTFDQITLAKEYIPYVMVEMPVLPGTFEEMKEVLLELDRLGVFSINLLEFCFPMNNAKAFREQGYTIRARPFRVLYNYWYAGGLPVAGSELVCLDLLDYAMESRLKMGVHYCSLENKHSGQVYQQNFGNSFSDTLYFSQKDYFLKSAKVFGADILPVRQIFDASNYENYLLSEEHSYLEFHVDKIGTLKKLDIEIGISTNILEKRADGLVLRELKVDVTTPKIFQMTKDV